jgi:pilus assembly protein Flp/PilA
MLKIRKLLRNRRGATALEYGLVAALVAIVIIGGLTQFGNAVNAMFNLMTNKVSAECTTAGIGGC